MFHHARAFNNIQVIGNANTAYDFESMGLVFYDWQRMIFQVLVQAQAFNQA